MKFVLLLLMLIPTFIVGQSSPTSLWCGSKCDAVGDEKKNTKTIFMKLNSQKSANKTLGLNEDLSTLEFELRIVFVQPSGKVSKESKKHLKTAIENVNEAFKAANIKFSIDKIETINSDLKVEDLTQNGYDPYLKFSDEHEKQNQMSIFIFDYNKELCMITESSIRCGRTGGFSFILSEKTNNLVLSLFDLQDKKTLVHEFGHFFGLYHTFEEAQFGKDDFQGDCSVLGDCLCDTPADPGTAYEVYVNYSTCEMMGFTDMSGNVYNPLINNYMTYYKPCYLTKYEFTNGQTEVLRMAARSDLRRKLAR